MLLLLLLRRACTVLLLQVQRAAVCFDAMIEAGLPSLHGLLWWQTMCLQCAMALIPLPQLT
jgi:hypothetical protein